MAKGKIIGIDLGTTYSCVSVFNDREGKFVVVPSRKGTNTTPSVVGLNKDGQVIVGLDAKARLPIDPDNTVDQIKRHMGEPFRDGAERAPRIGPDGQPVPYSVRFAGSAHTPQMISAYILKDLKAQAEEYLQEPVMGAVITVPAYFTGGPRKATEEAGRLAGLDVKCLVNEPTAAAIAFGFGTADTEDDGAKKRVLVYDLGGGTFDISVIEINQGNIEVLSVDGDHYLGGVDFDHKIIEWVMARVKEEYDVDLHPERGRSPDPAMANAYRKAYGRIFDEAEKAKIALSAQPQATINLPFLFPHKGDMVNFEAELGRNDFLLMIMPKLKETLETVDRALASAKLEKSQIDDVLLVGGSTRIPKIREMLERHFGKPPRKDINPDECVAMGAAMQALRYVDTKFLPPEQQEKVEEQLGRMGEVIDVTGHSLGIREGSDNMSVLIPKNSPIPAVQERTYVTASDFQKTVLVIVYQGEDPVASRNTKLTEFEVSDLPPLPAGQVKIKVKFELDINGVLQIEVTDLVRGQAVKVNTKYGGSTQADPKALMEMRTFGAAAQPGGHDARPASGSGSGLQIPTNMRDTWKQASEHVVKLQGPPKVKLEGAMKAFTDALGTNDSKLVENKGNELMDILFDVMM